MQRDTLVARAIVQHEIVGLGSGASLLPRLTTQRIVDKYGLAWGWFGPGSSGAERARQLIRNELNRAFRAGQIVKLRSNLTGKKLREGTNVLFTAYDAWLWADDCEHADLDYVTPIYG